MTLSRAVLGCGARRRWRRTHLQASAGQSIARFGLWQISWASKAWSAARKRPPVSPRCRRALPCAQLALEGVAKGRVSQRNCPSRTPTPGLHSSTAAAQRADTVQQGRCVQSVFAQFTLCKWKPDSQNRRWYMEVVKRALGQQCVRKWAGGAEARGGVFQKSRWRRVLKDGKAQSSRSGSSEWAGASAWQLCRARVLGEEEKPV